MGTRWRFMLLLLLPALWFSLLVKGSDSFETGMSREHANHIFNTLHSSMREWGSALHHNGMSAFLATIPKDTKLYHGTEQQEPVKGMEWVAFEREHAMQFSHTILTPMPLPPTQKIRLVDEDVPKNKPIPIQLEHPILASSQDLNLDPEIIWIFPGFLHTYITKRDLRLIYIDGSAAAKSAKGTLDLTDIVLLNDTSEGSIMDRTRAQRLCHMASVEWNGQIDGFIRMEAGFEVIMCSFTDALRLVDMQRINNGDNMTEKDGRGRVFHWLRAAAARYNGIGGSPARVILNYNNFITAYAYSLDLFQNKSSTLPRLIGADQKIVDQMRDNLTALISNATNFPAAKNDKTINWQAIADMIVAKYSDPLQYFATYDIFVNSSLRLSKELYYLLEPFISDIDSDRTRSIHRCTVEFIPHLLPSDNFQQATSVAQNAVYSVSHTICNTLFNVWWSLPFTSEDGFKDETPTHQLQSLKALIGYLNWTEWKKCKGCAWGEMCSIPMFPFGTTEDYDNPRCRGLYTLGRLTGYWVPEITS